MNVNPSDNNEVEQFLMDGLMKVVHAHAERTGTMLSSIGRYSVADPRIFQRLEIGGTITVRQWARLLKWIYDRWPADVAWPRDVIEPARRSVVPIRKQGRPSSRPDLVVSPRE